MSKDVSLMLHVIRKDKKKNTSTKKNVPKTKNYKNRIKKK